MKSHDDPWWLMQSLEMNLGDEAENFGQSADLKERSGIHSANASGQTRSGKPEEEAQTIRRHRNALKSKSQDEKTSRTE